MSESVSASDAAPAPAVTDSASSAPTAPASQGATAAPAFGTSRGSGLARGKRPGASAAASEKQAPAANYQPTAIQMITPVREYSNPFAPAETPAPAPETPVANAPVNPAANVPVAAPVVSETPVVEPVKTEAPAAKVELNILPPEPDTRRTQSWDSSTPAAEAAPATEARPRPAREGFNRDQNRDQNAAPRDGQREGQRNFREGDRRQGQGQGRRDRGDFQGRERSDFQNRERSENAGDNRPAAEGTDARPTFRPERLEQRTERKANEGGERRPEPRTFAPQKRNVPVDDKKSGGLIGWLKGLFAGKPEATPAQPQQDEKSRDFNRQGGHRGNRGGRDRNHNRGPRAEGDNRGGGHQGERREGGNGGGGGEGFRRGGNHRRGGRGRNFRGNRGDNGGGGGGRHDSAS